MFSANVHSKEGNAFYISVSFAKTKVGFLKLIAQVLNVYDVKNKQYFSRYHISKLEKQKLNSEDGGLNLSFGKGSLRYIPINRYKVTLNFDDVGIDGDFVYDKRPVLAHDKGAIDMGYGGKGHFFSISRMKVNGTVTCGGKKYTVSGTAWFDRQWGNWKDQGKGFAGWDWFNVHLEDGRDIAVLSFKEMNTNKRITPYCAVIDTNGNNRFYNDFTIKPVEVWKSSESKVVYPISWELIIPNEKITLNISAVKQEQETVMKFLWIRRDMWDGLCTVTGDDEGQSIRGDAFVKLSGSLGW